MRCACLLVLLGIFGHQTQNAPSSVAHGCDAHDLIFSFNTNRPIKLRIWNSRNYIAVNLNRPVAHMGPGVYAELHSARNVLRTHLYSVLVQLHGYERSGVQIQIWSQEKIEYSILSDKVFNYQPHHAIFHAAKAQSVRTRPTRCRVYCAYSR